MSNHERWVVYPLLFLSIGLALRNVVTQQQQEKAVDTSLIHSQAVDANIVRSNTVNASLVQCKVLEVSSLKGDRVLYLTHEGDDVSIVEGQLIKGRFLPQHRGRIIWQALQPPRKEDPSQKDEESEVPDARPEASEAESRKKAEAEVEQPGNKETPGDG